MPELGASPRPTGVWFGQVELGSRACRVLQDLCSTHGFSRCTAESGTSSAHCLWHPLLVKSKTTR